MKIVLLGVLPYLVALIFRFPVPVEIGLYGLSYLLIGGEVVTKAAKNLVRGLVFDENMLMTIATLGAFAVREYPEAVAVMLFYQIGEYFQDLAVHKSHGSIESLLAIRPDYANLKKNGESIRVKPEEVAVGDLIVVKPGERVPLDGKIIEGSSSLDTAALTGEAMPRELGVGDEILSGFINHSGLLVVEVLKKFGESTVAKILDLVRHAESRKAPTENFITKFARYYTPVVVGIAVALAFLPPVFLADASFSAWIYRGLIFLVISCPCALVISIPLGFFGGIGAASRKGILVKGSNYLEALNKVDTVVFDKTGTVTKGEFSVQEICPTAGFTAKEVLTWAAAAEKYSTHPIAQSIVAAAKARATGENNGDGVREDNHEDLENPVNGKNYNPGSGTYQEMPGLGVKAFAAGRVILVGNDKLMQAEAVQGFSEEKDGTGILREEGMKSVGTLLHVAVDNCYAGSMVIADQLKHDSLMAVNELRKLGVQRLVMLTGDSWEAATAVAKELQIDQYYAGLLPHEKVAHLEEISQNKGKGSLLFIGDGINDAPSLARADVGVAMGGLGSDAAIEAADVVIMTDEPSKLATAMRVAGRTRRVVWQNIIFALAIKGVILTLGAMGIATMWEAVFADVGVALLAVLNVLRVLKD